MLNCEHCGKPAVIVKVNIGHYGGLRYVRICLCKKCLKLYNSKPA